MFVKSVVLVSVMSTFVFSTMLTSFKLTTGVSLIGLIFCVSVITLDWEFRLFETVAVVSIEVAKTSNNISPFKLVAGKKSTVNWF